MACKSSSNCIRNYGTKVSVIRQTKRGVDVHWEQCDCRSITNRSNMGSWTCEGRPKNKVPTYVEREESLGKCANASQKNIQKTGESQGKKRKERIRKGERNEGSKKHQEGTGISTDIVKSASHSTTKGVGRKVGPTIDARDEDLGLTHSLCKAIKTWEKCSYGKEREKPTKVVTLGLDMKNENSNKLMVKGLTKEDTDIGEAIETMVEKMLEPLVDMEGFEWTSIKICSGRLDTQDQ